MVFVDQKQKSLEVLDWVIIGAYFLGCIFVGLWVSNSLISFFIWKVGKAIHEADTSNTSSLITKGAPERSDKIYARLSRKIKILHV